VVHLGFPAVESFLEAFGGRFRQLRGIGGFVDGFERLPERDIFEFLFHAPLFRESAGAFDFGKKFGQILFHFDVAHALFDEAFSILAVEDKLLDLVG
jgi:hypothetical protein